MGDFIYRLFSGEKNSSKSSKFIPFLADSARNCDTLDSVREGFKEDIVESSMFAELHSKLIELIDARLSKCHRYELWHTHLSKIFARARYGTDTKFFPLIN